MADPATHPDPSTAFQEWIRRASKRKRRDVLGLSAPIVAAVAAGYLLVLHAWSWWLFPAAFLCASVLFFGLSCWSRGYIAALDEAKKLLRDSLYGPEPVTQTVASWEGWPDDVRDRLRAWNQTYLLSFRRGPDFLCGGCGRRIRSHPNGNAVVRPRRKARGVLLCEDCLVRLARRHELPPPMAGRPRIETRLRRRIAALDSRLARLREQLRLDQIYIDRLEEQVDADHLAAIRNDLRGKHRRALRR